MTLYYSLMENTHINSTKNIETIKTIKNKGNLDNKHFKSLSFWLP